MIVFDANTKARWPEESKQISDSHAAQWSFFASIEIKNFYNKIITLWTLNLSFNLLVKLFH